MSNYNNINNINMNRGYLPTINITDGSHTYDEIKIMNKIKNNKNNINNLNNSPSLNGLMNFNLNASSTTSSSTSSKLSSPSFPSPLNSPSTYQRLYNDEFELTSCGATGSGVVVSHYFNSVEDATGSNVSLSTPPPQINVRTGSSSPLAVSELSSSCGSITRRTLSPLPFQLSNSPRQFASSPRLTQSLAGSGIINSGSFYSLSSPCQSPRHQSSYQQQQHPSSPYQSSSPSSPIQCSSPTRGFQSLSMSNNSKDDFLSLCNESIGNTGFMSSSSSSSSSSSTSAVSSPSASPISSSSSLSSSSSNFSPSLSSSSTYSSPLNQSLPIPNLLSQQPQPQQHYQTPIPTYPTPNTTKSKSTSTSTTSFSPYCSNNSKVFKNKLNNNLNNNNNNNNSVQNGTIKVEKSPIHHHNNNLQLTSVLPQSNLQMVVRNRFECDHNNCGKNFSSPQSRSNHYNLKHSMKCSTADTCSQCIRNLKIQSSPKSKCRHYGCDKICSSANLAKHEKTPHHKANYLDKFSCSKCDDHNAKYALPPCSTIINNKKTTQNNNNNNNNNIETNNNNQQQQRQFFDQQQFIN